MEKARLLVSLSRKALWGFSYFIEGMEKTILFDTGTNPAVLQHDIKQLRIDISKVKQLVISNEHEDHTGGLAQILAI